MNPDFDVLRRIMVDTQVRPADVTSYPLLDAMLSVPREEFVPPTFRDVAYMEGAITIGTDRIISDPRQLAKSLQELALNRKDMVLVIGAGYGYASAVIAHMVEAVVAIEDDKKRAGDTEAALLQNGVHNAAIIVDELANGAAAHGPYDAIFVEGAMDRVPEHLCAQLKEGGKIAAIRKIDGLYRAALGIKTADIISWRPLFAAQAPVLPGFALEPEFEF